MEQRNQRPERSERTTDLHVNTKEQEHLHAALCSSANIINKKIEGLWDSSQPPWKWTQVEVQPQIK